MKKVIAALIAVLMLASICGCKEEKKNAGEQNSRAASQTVQPSDDASAPENPEGQSESQSKVTSGNAADSGSETASTASAGSETASAATESEDDNTEVPEWKTEVYLMADSGADGIRVSVRIRHNIGIAGMLIGINYDESKVTPVSISKSKIKVTSNLQQKDTPIHGTVTAVYADEKGFDNDCEMFYVMFKPIGSGSTEFTITSESNSFVNLKNEYVKVDTSGSVKVDL